jgi:hypothetical protein
MTVDQIINFGVLLVGVVSVMLPFHLQNRSARMHDRQLLDKVWRRLKRHDRRVTILGDRLSQLEARNVSRRPAADRG